ncbi:hypothetical protein [Thermanaerovibrio acidaminovorans]|uniref:hypothetical protein n=1 Tax=Thermanaerovibrio acidaminovorans TaxID=81462 RepID=UPI002491C17E|nr:hypothetical protein [Thermanaerovibrio acidaminovorans]
MGRRLWGLLLVASFLVPILPVGYRLVVADRTGTILIRAPLFLGHGLLLRSEHSLERSILEDRLVVCDGALWVWWSFVRTYNAGIPTEVPKGGVMRVTDTGTAFIGGRRRLPDPLVYRVGDRDLGKNEAWIYNKRVCLFKIFPKRKLNFSVVPRQEF